MRALGLCALVLASCSSTDAVDADADAAAEAAPLADGKADGIGASGLYAVTSSALQDGDIANLELRVDGHYVRSRCYGLACARRHAETDRFDSFTSSTGRTYVRFWSFRADDTTPERTQHPVVADTYEIVRTSTTIRLRKTYTSRWFSLRKRLASSVCTQSGGSWTTECDCGPNNTWPGPAFVPGAGGCMIVSGTDESECEDTGGFYTDDDATLIGAYCECGAGRYPSDSGCAAN